MLSAPNINQAPESDRKVFSAPRASQSLHWHFFLQSTYVLVQCTEVRFASFISSGFITAIVVNPPEKKLTKRTSVQCNAAHLNII